MKKLRPLNWFPPVPLLVAAVVSGVLLSTAFPPFSLGFVSFVALIPVVVWINRGRYPRKVLFRTGYAFGVAFFLSHLWWIVELLPASSITIPWLMVPALIILVMYLALYPALFFLLLGMLSKGRSVAVVLLGPALWLLLEVVRSSGELGFSWGAVGYALSRYPAHMQLASAGGLLGLGAFIVLVNMLWSQVFVAKRVRAKAVYFLLGALLLIGNALYGRKAIESFDHVEPERRFTVAVAQPNVDLDLKWKPEFADSTFRLISRQARQASLSKPALLVFPETSAPVYIRYKPKYYGLLMTLASELDMDIFIGFLDGRRDGPDEGSVVYNSSGLFTSDGRFLQYDKMHLLPFGEAIPFAWRFRVLSKLDFGQANFFPGPSVAPIASEVGRLGPLICFESIFSDLSRRFVADGADVLVNITNDGWFGDTPGPFQHRDMAIVRAVENRRYLLRSANTGVSMVVDPVGRVIGSMGLDQEGILIANIRPVTRNSLYTRLGDLPLVISALLLLVVGSILARRSPARANL